MSAAVLGLDIGGANLKGAHTDGAARSQVFELWKHPAGLTDTLREFVAGFPPVECLAVSMTGELCDCFETRRHGVHAILDAVASVADGRPVSVWNNQGRFCDLATARKEPLAIASANWLALATFAARYAPFGAGLLIDIGSTTTDIIPLVNGRPVPRGRTDAERLQTQELVYTGVRRTPLCALLGSEGAAELFATTLDAYLILERLADDPTDCHTADGRPATRAAAHARLARMLCADADTCSRQQTLKLAERVLLKQVRGLVFAIQHIAETLPAPPGFAIVAGSGEFLARLVLSEAEIPASGKVVSLREILGESVSQAACAHAVALLAAEATKHGR